MRPVTDEIYGIPPERVIGSSNALRYVGRPDGGSLVYLAQPDVFDDGPAKPVRIWSRIGRRPILAVGNSNGDIADAAVRRRPVPAGAAAAACSMTTRRANSTTPPAPRSPRSGEGAGLDRRQHQERLEGGVRVSEGAGEATRANVIGYGQV